MLDVSKEYSTSNFTEKYSKDRTFFDYFALKIKVLHSSEPSVTTESLFYPKAIGGDFLSDPLSREQASVASFQTPCIVVGSRRLMPPDALQPKAYCTNPGL